MSASSVSINSGCSRSMIIMFVREQTRRRSVGLSLIEFVESLAYGVFISADIARSAGCSGSVRLPTTQARGINKEMRSCWQRDRPADRVFF